jgi:hypothetical protein
MSYDLCYEDRNNFNVSILNLAIGNYPRLLEDIKYHLTDEVERVDDSLNDAIMLHSNERYNQEEEGYTDEGYLQFLQDRFTETKKQLGETQILLNRVTADTCTMSDYMQIAVILLRRRSIFPDYYLAILEEGTSVLTHQGNPTVRWLG